MSDPNRTTEEQAPAGGALQGVTGAVGGILQTAGGAVGGYVISHAISLI